MVATKPKKHTAPSAGTPSKPKLFGTTVQLSEVVAAGTRLEASCYAPEARNAVEIMRAAGLTLVPVYGSEGLCREAHSAFRFKRIFVKQDHGVPFFTSADIISTRQRPDKFLSNKTKKIDRLKVEHGNVLISRSGTIGNSSLAGKSLSGKAISEDVIRLIADNSTDSGYLIAFLRSSYGRRQLLGIVYGAVIQHIEPEHMSRILIPDLHPIIKTSIGSKMLEAVSKRDDANILLDDAEALLLNRLGLPPLKMLEKNLSRSPVTVIQAKELEGRLDASYHSALAMKVIEALGLTGFELVPLGDKRVCSEILAVTKFRSRVYVRNGGIPMLNSKQISQVDPIDVKHLASGAHTKDMKEISLKTNMITVSCSGTIGNVEIIPQYMNGWAANQHTLRVTASKSVNPGYIYAWLASPHGNCLLKKFSYGAVILEIDRYMLRSLPLPLLTTEEMDEVGGMVLKANSLRNKAWELERAAIKELETILEGKSAAAKS